MAGARPPRAAPLSRELRALGRDAAQPVPLVASSSVWALVILGLAYQARPRYAIDVGSRTDLAFWNRRERRREGPATRATYRWTAPDSALTLPGVGSGAYRAAARPERRPPARLPAARCGGRGGRPDAGDTAARARPPGLRCAGARRRPPATATCALTLRTTNPFQPPGDPRQLGVALYGSQVEPLDGGPGRCRRSRIWLLFSRRGGAAALLLGWRAGGRRVVRLGGLLWALGAGAAS